MVGGLAVGTAVPLSVPERHHAGIRTTPTQHCRLDVGIVCPASSLQWSDISRTANDPFAVTLGQVSLIRP